MGSFPDNLFFGSIDGQSIVAVSKITVIVISAIYGRLIDDPTSFII